MEKIEVYYGDFLYFLDAMGNHQKSVKAAKNLEDGVHPVQEMVNHYYGGERWRLEQAIDDRDRERKWALNQLDQSSQKVGFLPISQKYKEIILLYFEDYDRRRYLRNNIRRALEKGELLSMTDLIEKRMGCERKRKEKEASEAGD